MTLLPPLSALLPAVPPPVSPPPPGWEEDFRRVSIADESAAALHATIYY